MKTAILFLFAALAFAQAPTASPIAAGASGGSGSGTVTEVSGTANQVCVATGTTTPVLSICTALDLSGLTSTKPIKSGTSLPATCGVGEFYDKTNATAGVNLYSCTATNTWTVVGGSVTSVSGTAPIAVATGTTTPVISLNDTAVTPGAYTSADITIDAKGRITAAASGTSGTVVSSAPPYIVIAGASIIPKGMFTAVTPDALSPSWLNQGGASEATTNKARILTVPNNNGVSVRLRTVSMVAATTLTAAFSAQLINVYGQVTRCGIGALNGTADFSGIWLTSSGSFGNTIELGDYSTTTGTFTSHRAAGVSVSQGDVIYVKLLYISADLYNWQYSMDGTKWTSINTSDYATAATPSDWFYGCDNNQSGATVGNIFMTLFSFSAS